MNTLKCAKLMSSMMPYTIVKPSASRAYIMPSDSPLTSCCRTTASAGVISVSMSFRGGAEESHCWQHEIPRCALDDKRLGLRGSADVLVAAVLNLEDRDDLL